MVTVYQLACKLVKDPEIAQYMKAKWINKNILTYKVIYEFYCAEKARGIRNSEAITFTGEEFELSDNMIWQIKYQMESLIS